MKEKKKEETKSERKTTIIVNRTFGNHKLEDILSDYVAKKIRASKVG